MKLKILILAALLLPTVAGAQYDPYGWQRQQQEQQRQLDRYQEQQRLERIERMLREQQQRAEQERQQRQWRIEQELRNKYDRQRSPW